MEVRDGKLKPLSLISLIDSSGLGLCTIFLNKKFIKADNAKLIVIQRPIFLFFMVNNKINVKTIKKTFPLYLLKIQL